MSSSFLPYAAQFLQVLGWIVFPLLILPLAVLAIPNRLAGFAHALITAVDSFSYRIGEILKWSLLLMVLAIGFEVLALAIFGLSWTKISEIAIYVNVAVVLAGSATTLLSGQHVRVDIFHSRLSPHGKARVDIAGFYALLLPMMLILLWKSQGYVALSWASLEGSPEADGIKGVFILKTLIPVFALSMIAQGLAIATRGALVIAGLNRPKRPEHVPSLFGQNPEEPAV